MTEIEIPTSSFIEKFKATPGAISVTESIAIFNIAKLAPEGIYIELGSHKGKSAMSASLGLKQGRFYLVDPIFDDEKLGYSVCDSVEKCATVKLEARFLPSYSTDVLSSEEFKGLKYSYVFWDSGEHAGEVLKQERDMLEDALVSGGILCSHDIGNQFTQQKEAMDWLVATGKYEWIEIDWAAIIKYVRDNNLEEGNNSWHEKGSEEFPKFVGALRRK